MRNGGARVHEVRVSMRKRGEPGHVYRVLTVQQIHVLNEDGREGWWGKSVRHVGGQVGLRGLAYGRVARDMVGREAEDPFEVWHGWDNLRVQGKHVAW